MTDNKFNTKEFIEKNVSKGFKRFQFFRNKLKFEW